MSALGMLLPLIVFGSVQAPAFPNAGVEMGIAVHGDAAGFTGPPKRREMALGILGSYEFAMVNHRFHPMWRDMLSRIGREKSSYDRCGGLGTACAPKLRQWRALLASLKDEPEAVQLARLNASVNAMARYADDRKIHGTDHWSTPLEFLQGTADCEDYATVKFWSLLELGYDNDQLRFAVVRDERRRMMHAVVTVDTGNATFVLDSLFDTPVEQSRLKDYAPIFSANLDTHWVHLVTKGSRAVTRARTRTRSRFIDWT